MIDESKYLEWMNDYFHEADADEPENYKKWVDYLLESDENKTLFGVWNAMIDGRLGMYVRNHMREKHPEIDNDFPNYGDFEDYSWELIQKLVERWKG